MQKEPTAPVIQINSAGYPTKGSAKAKISIIEFADYNCIHCKHASQSLKEIYKKYSQSIQFTYMDFPLSNSGVSKRIAEGAVCADEQKKFWEYHYLAFDNQSTLTNGSPINFAKQLNLKEDQFKKCLDSQKTKEKVELARNEGERIGVSGTPSIYINGRKQKGYSFKNLEKEIKKLL